MSGARIANCSSKRTIGPSKVLERARRETALAVETRRRPIALRLCLQLDAWKVRYPKPYLLLERHRKRVRFWDFRITRLTTEMRRKADFTLARSKRLLCASNRTFEQTLPTPESGRSGESELGSAKRPHSRYSGRPRDYPKAVGLFW